jgi:uncharacterized protein
MSRAQWVCARDNARMRQARDLFGTHHDALARLCRAHGVRRLEVFGSAAGPEFDPARSDIDLLVDFGPEAEPELFSHYFELKQQLQQLLGREVDLVMQGALRNPYFIRAVERSRREIYASPHA